MNSEKPKSPQAHLKNGELADYLDRKLSGEELLRAEAHLADCDYCCEQVIVATRSLSDLEQKSRRPLMMWTGLAAATLAGVLILAPGLRGPDTAQEPILRDGSGALSQAGEEPIEVLAPSLGAELRRDSLHFAWRSIAPEALYSFTVTDAVGDVIWEGTTKDTALDLTSRIMIDDGKRYFWYVDALFGEGRSASTGVREFSAAE